MSESLYQLDAATRVVARVVRERDEYRRLAEEGVAAKGAAHTEAIRQKKNTNDEPAKKKAKTGGWTSRGGTFAVDGVTFWRACRTATSEV